MTTPHHRRVNDRRARSHRARSLLGTLGLTAVGTALPGLGIWLTGRRGIGLVVMTVALLLGGFGWYAVTNESAALEAAVDPDKLLAAAIGSAVLLLGLVAVVVATYRMARRPSAPRAERFAEVAFVAVLCLLVAAPFAMGARYAFVQRDLVSTVFVDRGEVVADEESPWGDDDRVNVLLLGGDGGVNRLGIRTDTVILASLDAQTGNTVLFSLPRNLREVPFPPGSMLSQVYPEGFTGEGDPLEWMLNAVYGKVPELHPELFDGADNEGGQAVKTAVSGALGIEVDHYVLVNLRGFQEVVDAIGGITVNINQPIPIGGNTDRGIPPEDYLDPGPEQELDGFEALWFARGRYGLDDYNRMERQRCVVDALLDEANPVTLLQRYEALADAGKKIVRTDIPQDLLPAFVELGMKLRDGRLRSVVFRPNDQFNPNDPDYDYVQQKVQRTLAKAEQERESASDSDSEEEQASEPSGDDGSSGGDAGADRSAGPIDPCAYDPEA